MPATLFKKPISVLDKFTNHSITGHILPDDVVSSGYALYPSEDGNPMAASDFNETL